MRDLLKPTLVCWETRNWRHHKKAMEWCKNYGLYPLTRTIYIGNLKTRELSRIENSFKDLFIKKTEKYYLFPLHDYTVSQLSGKTDHIRRNLSQDVAFEIT